MFGDILKLAGTAGTLYGATGGSIGSLFGSPASASFRGTPLTLHP